MSIVLTGVAAQVVWHERLGFGKDIKGNLVIIAQSPRYVIRSSFHLDHLIVSTHAVVAFRLFCFIGARVETQLH